MSIYDDFASAPADCRILLLQLPPLIFPIEKNDEFHSVGVDAVVF